MTNQFPLNPDALEKARNMFVFMCADGFIPKDEDLVRGIVSAYLAVAQPVVTGERVNLAGWTCDGIHEPGSYATCEDCRGACDDLARFYNHMMRNPRPFKHWTGNSEVKS